MKTLIIYVSLQNANTKRIAKAIAEVLDATLLEPEEIDMSTLQDYDLIGLGSGIYYGRFYKRLRNFVKQLPTCKNTKAFLFATIGHGEAPYKPIKKLLAEKGVEVVGEFSCLGFNTWLLAGLFGRQNKGRPNAEDFERAREFAKSLKVKYQAA
ncbi:MAG: flavodoxin family protein [Desulfobacteraceae bacterium]|nr:flavodoxin family protein [Desulfobacteraceae bacterium]